MNYFLTIIAIILAGHQSVSQSRNLDDSSYLKNDSIGITEQLRTAKQLYNLQLYDSVISLSEIILSQSLDHNYIRGIGEAYFLKARGLSRLGRREKAIEMYGLAIERFKYIKDPDRLASAYNNLGILYRAGGDFRAAIQAGEQALQQVSHSENNQLKFNILNNLGNSYQRIALFKKAGDVYFDALKLIQNESDSLSQLEMRAEVNINLGLIYLMQRLMDKALTTFHEARLILETLSLEPQLATVYFNLGYTYAENMEDNSARKYIKLAEKLYEGLNDEIGKALCRRTNGQIYYVKKLFDQAAKEQQDAVSRLEELEAFIYLPYSYMLLGDTYLASGHPDKAELSLLKGLQIALKSGQKVEELKIYEGLIDLYKSQDELRLALLYYDIHAALSQELNDQQIGRHIGQLELKQLLTSRDQALKMLESETAKLHFQVGRKSLLLTLSSCLLLSTIVLFYLIFRQYRLRSQNRRIKLEQKILRTQLNPHFIFNALGAIQHYLIINAPEKAAKYLSKFSKLMRAFLENSRRDQVELFQELQVLRNYIDLQALRFTSHFDYEIEVDENLDPETIQIPSMITQPLVENAIEHGLIPQNGGQLSIVVRRSRTGYRINIIDNGVGLPDGLQTGLEKNSGLGIVITRQRVSLLNKGNRKKIVFNLRNRSNDKSSSGTSAELILPIA